MSDCINRADAMELINKCVSHTSPKAKVMDFRHGEINGLNWACDIIEAMPSADVALVKHGRWYKNDQDKLLMRIRCSICNKAIYSENHFAYCPNCGARMDGEDNEID